MLIDLRFQQGRLVLTEQNLLVQDDRSSIVDFTATTGDPFTAEIWQEQDGIVVAFRHQGWNGSSARWRFPPRERKTWGKAELLYNTTDRNWHCQYRIDHSR